MIKHACGRDEEVSGVEILTTCDGGVLANSDGDGTAEIGFRPFPSMCPPSVVVRGFGRSGAPHSSQYWEPSRFSVLHRSQVIIGNLTGAGAVSLDSTLGPAVAAAGIGRF